MQAAGENKRKVRAVRLTLPQLMSPSRRPTTLVSEFVNQSPLQNTCEATDGLTLFRFTSCVDSVHKNQYTNDEFFTASQPKPSLILQEPRGWHIYQREFFDDAH